MRLLTSLSVHITLWVHCSIPALPPCEAAAAISLSSIGRWHSEYLAHYDRLYSIKPWAKISLSSLVCARHLVIVMRKVTNVHWSIIVNTWLKFPDLEKLHVPEWELSRGPKTRQKWPSKAHPEWIYLCLLGLYPQSSIEYYSNTSVWEQVLKTRICEGHSRLQRQQTFF